MIKYQTPRLFILMFSMLLLATNTWVSADQATANNSNDPQAVIAGDTKQLLMEIKNQKDEIIANQQVAYDLSDKYIVPHLDFPRITRLVIGKHWRRAQDEQKTQLVNEIRQMLIRSYVTAMRTYADQIIAASNQITYLPSRYKAGDKKTSVRAAIKLQNGNKVDVQYMLYNTNNTWKIYDIRVGGISLAITYRTSFNEEIQRNGLDGLINDLSEKNQKGTVDFPGGTNSPISNVIQ